MEAGLAFPCVCDTASLPHLNIYLPCIRNICYVLLGTSSKLYHWPDLSIMTDHADLSSQNPKRCIYILALQQVQASAPMSLKLYHPGIFLDLSTSRTNSFSLLRHPSAVSCPYPTPVCKLLPTGQDPIWHAITVHLRSSNLGSDIMLCIRGNCCNHLLTQCASVVPAFTDTAA